ncbi:MAG: hypothetical protein ACPGVZ_07090 [Myxococcota bacterium]
MSETDRIGRAQTTQAQGRIASSIAVEARRKMEFIASSRGRCPKAMT